MAKNKARKSKPKEQAKPANEAVSAETKSIKAETEVKAEAKAGEAVSVKEPEAAIKAAAETSSLTEAETAKTVPETENMKTAAAGEIPKETAAADNIDAQSEENAGKTKKAESGKESSNDSKKKKTESGRESSNNTKKKNNSLRYQVKTKKDSGVIKAYITFTYRVLHPAVSARLVIYGILVALPGIFFFRDLYWKCFFTGIGIALILLAFFRQYISLWMTKNNDPDYKSGADFTYDFRENDAEFRKNGERFSKLDRYKDITNFYYDDEYFYLALISRDLFIIPKAAFTVGDAAGFEEFIYKKSKHTCRWIPNKLSDRIKKRRAQRAFANKDLHSKDLFK